MEQKQESEKINATGSRENRKIVQDRLKEVPEQYMKPHHCL
jgi:hypothetical protein